MDGGVVRERLLNKDIFIFLMPMVRFDLWGEGVC